MPSRLDRLLPTHRDMWKGIAGDATALHGHAASFEHPRAIERVTIGDRVDPGIVPARGLR